MYEVATPSWNSMQALQPRRSHLRAARRGACRGLWPDRREVCGCSLMDSSCSATPCYMKAHVDSVLWAAWYCTWATRKRIVSGIQSSEDTAGQSACTITLQRVCRVADGSMSVDEAYSRHKQLLKRQHFGREPPNVRKFF